MAEGTSAYDEEKGTTAPSEEKAATTPYMGGGAVVATPMPTAEDIATDAGHAAHWRLQKYGSPDGGITEGTLNQRFGRWGSPWGRVPPALDAHLRRITGYDRSRMYDMVGDEAHAGQDYSSTMSGMSAVEAERHGKRNPHHRHAIEKKLKSKQGKLKWPTRSLERSKEVTLVEEAPGRWVWSGWEDDPEYLAYQETIKGQRMLAAREQQKGSVTWQQHLYGEEDEMSKIAQLFGTYEDMGQGLRYGQTEATRQSPWPSDPSQEGYLGQQSAAFSPIKEE